MTAPGRGAADRAAARRKCVLVIGDVMSDVIVRPDGPLARGTDRAADIKVVPGGSAANLAAWLVFAGLDAVMVGRVGQEDHARQEALLRAAGVTPVLAADPVRPTGILVALIAPDGERSFFTDRGANEGLARADLPDQLLGAADLVHVSGYALQRPGPRAAVHDFLRAAAAAGVPASIDPGSVSLLDEVGPAGFLAWTGGIGALCVPNADEAAVLAGSGELRRQLDVLCRHYQAAVVKRGALGAAAREAGVDHAAEAPLTSVVDTTGAGDAFLAGFLAARLTGAGLAESLRRGCVLGALAVGLVGGRPPSESACKGATPVPS